MHDQTERSRNLAEMLDWVSASDAKDADGKRTTLAEVKAMVWRQRIFVATMVAAALLVGVIATLLMTSRFQSIATVRIDNETIQVIKGDDVNPVVNGWDTDRFLNAQKAVFMSRSMAYNVIDRLRLDQNETFITAMTGDGLDNAATTPKEAAHDRREAVADILQDKVEMEIPAVNRIAQIRFNAPKPEISQKIANTYVQAFVENNILSRYNATSYARNVLTQQVQESEARLRQTETEAITYARANRLIDFRPGDSGGSGTSFSPSSGGSITLAGLGQINQALGEARKTRIQAEQRWRIARSSNVLSLPEARDNKLLETLQGQKATASAELEQLSQNYLDDHPQVLQARARLNETNAQINLVSRHLRASLENDYRIALNEERQLANAVAASSSAILTEQNKRVEYDQLLRNAQSQRNRLLELERRLGEVNSLSDIATNNISLVDHATLPDKAVSPNLLRSLALALAVGLIVGLGLGILREVIDDTLWSPDDAEAKLGRPLLGTTPAVKGLSAQEAFSDHGNLSEAYFGIRSALDYATQGNVHKVIQVTSCQPSEGKSTTSIALASDFARVGRRVMLVDCDMRRPSIHRQLGIENDKGLIDVLVDAVPLAQVAHEQFDNFHVLMLGSRPSNPAQILSGDQFVRLIEQLRSDYDVVILDSPPVMGMADASLISRTVDGAVLIIEAGRSHFGQARQAVRRIEDAGTRVVGVVMTKFNYRDAGYNYDYHYNYYGYSDATA